MLPAKPRPLVSLVISVGFWFGTSSLLAADKVTVVLDAQLPAPARLAAADLDRALKGHGCETSQANSLSQDSPFSIVLGIPSSSKVVAALLAEQRVDLPRRAEALCVKRFQFGAGGCC